MASVLCHLCGHTAPGAREGDRCPADDRALVPASEHAARPQDPYLGRFVGGYPLLALVRPSSVGPTYRALKEPGRREVAVKVLRPTGAIEPIGARLRKIMPVVFGLEHPAVVKPLDYGVDPDGVLFVVTEPLRGTSLAELVSGKKPVPADRAVPLVVQLLRALAEAHKRGVVHGNLKPGNVMLVLGPEGEDSVRLLELGIAEVLRPREDEPSAGAETLGTPFYISPEQAKGLPASPLADLYSTGVILYELLSGAPPYDFANPMETARAHVEAPIPQFAKALQIPPALDRVVCRALAKTPEDRFQGVAAMAEALEAILAPGVEKGDDDEDGEDLRKTQPFTLDDIQKFSLPVKPQEPAKPAEPEPEEAEDEKTPPPAPRPESEAEPAPPVDDAGDDREQDEPASKPAPMPQAAAATPPRAPPRKSKVPLIVGGAVAGSLVLLVAAFLAIRATPVDGSGSMLDLVRTVGSGGDGAKLTIPEAYQDEPVKPGEPPRRVVRREAPRAVDAAVPEPPDAEAPAPPPAAEPPPPEPSKAEAMLAAVDKPDGSLLINCANRCKVYVDGGLVGESPKAGIPLKEGEHHLRAVNVETGEEREQMVKIKSAQRTRVTVDL